MVKRCVVCGAEFSAPPSSKKITCCASCSSVRKRASHLNKSNVWTASSRRALSQNPSPNLAKGTPAAMASPKAGRFVTNVNAKDWHISSPDGTDYYFRSLALWTREHCSLFSLPSTDANARKIAQRFRDLKASALGKPYSRSKSYHGWSIILDINSKEDNNK